MREHGSTHLRDPVVRRGIKALVDLVCCTLSVGLAIAIAEDAHAVTLRGTGFALAVACFFVAAGMLAGSYRAMWRYTSFSEAARMALTGLGMLAGLLLGCALDLLSFSPSTILLMVLLMLSSCAGVRALRRWQITRAKGRERQRQPLIGATAAHRVLIAGAGEHGLSLSRDLMQVPWVDVVGFLDDDLAKLGAYLHGVPVLGPLADVLAVAEQYAVSEVIVAMPGSDRDLVRRFVRRVEDAGLRVRTLRGVERFVIGRDLHRPGDATVHELLGDSPGGHPVGDGAPRRILVTGGAGYIGSHLTRLLLQRGYHVRVLDRFDYGRSGIAGLEGEGRLELIAGDICNSRDVNRAIRGVEGVVALAAIVGDPACNLDPEETVNLNYTATKILIEACSFYGVRRLVFASSCSVYGASNDTLLTERSRLNPVSLYARTRVLSENIIFDRWGDVEPVVLRLSTVFGLSPRMRFDLVVNTFTAQAVVDGRITIFGGNQWRPNVHCRDAARAFALALEAPAAAAAGEIFNVGGESLNHRIDELGALVAEHVGNVEVARCEDSSDPRNYRVSFEKIRSVIGFVPERSVADGIREVAAALRADPALRHYCDAVYHNVQALRRQLEGPGRRECAAA
jgi:nucleoside-diphosphate-sugar epimerase